MAGRGRGRGRGTPISAIADTLGVGRGEMINIGVLQPPPLYPPREFKPLPMLEDKQRLEDVAVKQSFRQACRKQPYYIRKPSDKKGVDRYTDRYRENSQVTDNTIGWTPNWSKFPDELRIKVRCRLPGGAGNNAMAGGIRPNLAANRRRRGNQVDVTKTLEMLEAKEKEEGGQDDKDDDDDNEDDYDNDEDENDEETDYIVSHFDNGEDYGFDDDDNMDEGVDF